MQSRSIYVNPRPKWSSSSLPHVGLSTLVSGRCVARRLSSFRHPNHVLSSWFASSCKHHLFTVHIFALAIYHSIGLFLQTGRLKLTCFTKSFLHSLSGSIWTVFADFGHWTDLRGTGIRLFQFLLFTFFVTCARLSSPHSAFKVIRHHVCNSEVINKTVILATVQVRHTVTMDDWYTEIVCCLLNNMAFLMILSWMS